MSVQLPIDDAASVSVARQQARSLGEGLPEELIEKAALVVSELGHNQLRYGRLGEITLTRRGEHGLDVLAVDTGPGLADPVRAFSGTGSSADGLGMGLAGVRRAARELCLDLRQGSPLRILARLRTEAAPRQPEWVMTGRPHPDEHQSGDIAAVFELGPRSVLAVVADGLGHGPEAHLAAKAAIHAIHEDPGAEPEHLLERCDLALRATRGAAVGVARIEGDRVHAAIGGNIRVAVLHADRTEHVRPVAKVVGSRVRRTFRSSVHALDGGTVLLTSDGISERDLPHALPLQGWPLGLACRLLARHARDNDDCAILALR